MEYQITLSVPDHLDPLLQIDGYRKKFVTERVTEFIGGLLSSEMMNDVDHWARTMKVDIARVGENPDRHLEEDIGDGLGG